MRRLEDRVLQFVSLVLHNLLKQVSVDLTKTTVEHFASFEHVEDAIREDLLSMHSTINVEEELTVA